MKRIALIAIALFSIMFVSSPAQADPMTGTMTFAEWNRIDFQAWPSLKGTTQRNAENDCNCLGVLTNTYTSHGYTWKEWEYNPEHNGTFVSVAYMKVGDTWHAKGGAYCFDQAGCSLG